MPSRMIGDDLIDSEDLPTDDGESRRDDYEDDLNFYYEKRSNRRIKNIALALAGLSIFCIALLFFAFHIFSALNK